MPNIFAINKQSFVRKFLEICEVINCQIFSTENHNFHHSNTSVILPVNTLRDNAYVVVIKNQGTFD